MYCTDGVHHEHSVSKGYSLLTSRFTFSMLSSTVMSTGLEILGAIQRHIDEVSESL